MIRWVGIDEAGYGPNLGPLVMSAVLVETRREEFPSVWSERFTRAGNGGGDHPAIWVDDSKKITAAKQGIAHLEASALTFLSALPPGGITATFSDVCARLVSGTLREIELERWLLPDAEDPGRALDALPRLGEESREMVRQFLARGDGESPFAHLGWDRWDARSVVVGPEKFAQGLMRHPSKAGVHAEAFGQLIAWAWDHAGKDAEVRVRGDKHGGRHFYLDLLHQALPDVWIDRGTENPQLSQYTVRDSSRGARMEVRFTPRADSEDGLVAWSSILSKTVREWWMVAFNAFWQRHIPGLRPTAGYPGDAGRFRDEISAAAMQLSIPPDLWWRSK